MAIVRVLYVSQSMLAAGAAEHELGQIIRRSQQHNAAQAITGALLWSGTHFAQILEGDPSAVGALLERLPHDPRHFDLEVIAAAPAARRRFEHWSMAYCGRAAYVQRHIEALRVERSALTVGHLERLMRELVAVGGVGVEALTTPPASAA